MSVQVFFITLMTATVALMSTLPTAVAPPVIDESSNFYIEFHLNKRFREMTLGNDISSFQTIAALGM